MARCSQILMIFLALVPVFLALDCRKFSFAPACRGIMLKRSGAHPGFQTAEQSAFSQEDVEKSVLLLSKVMLNEDTTGDCVSLATIFTKLTELKNGY